MSLEKITDPQIDAIIKKASHFGFDFNNYKTTFLKRRIDVRLRTRGVQNYSEYSDLLDSTESNALFKSISINVTEFFRDMEVFTYITQDLVPKLLIERSPTIRVWSAGCATGEEPHSLAILLNEACKTKLFKVYATDISTNAVESAKKGVYASASLKNLSPELLAKYFTIGDDGHHISSVIKNHITFNVADLTSFEVKFLDVIVCRNVFIYYTKETQDMILKKFHNCLKDTGYLVLGMDEGIRAEQTSMFESINPRLRIYKKVPQ